MRWFTSDLHFGHKNIINFTRRPFHSVDNMNRMLVHNWNQIVAPDDVVYVVGDFAMGNIDRTLPIARRLNGYKILKPGNHDRCWYGHLSGKKDWKVYDWSRRYIDAGFDQIVHGELIIDVAGHDVRVDHFPYRGDSRDEIRFKNERPVDDGMILIHGHTHSANRVDGNMIHVGTDAWGFYPASEEEIATIIINDIANRNNSL